MCNPDDSLCGRSIRASLRAAGAPDTLAPPEVRGSAGAQGPDIDRGIACDLRGAGWEDVDRSHCADDTDRADSLHSSGRRSVGTNPPTSGA